VARSSLLRAVFRDRTAHGANDEPLRMITRAKRSAHLGSAVMERCVCTRAVNKPEPSSGSELGSVKKGQLSAEPSLFGRAGAEPSTKNKF
jgi:hypothetical protein